MKAIVLAGGHATRLWPLTRDRAKPLLPLAGKPIASYVMDQLQAMDDVDEILVSTNAKYADDFRDFCDEHGYDAAEVVVEEHVSEKEKVGSLGAIMQVIAEHGRDDYVVVGGDNYTSLDLAEFVRFGQEKDAPTLACYEVETRDDAKPFGVVGVDGDRITDFVEKPDEPPSNLVSTLFYYLPADALEMLDAYQDDMADSDVDHLDEPGRLIEWAHDRQELYAYAFDGAWYDIGTPANYLQAQAALAEGRVDGEVTESNLEANVWVMEGAEVHGSELEDCIIFPGAEIEDSSLQGTIVDEEAVVDGVSLEESVIGAFSTVR